jgi:hypothetical protein
VLISSSKIDSMYREEAAVLPGDVEIGWTSAEDRVISYVNYVVKVADWTPDKAAKARRWLRVFRRMETPLLYVLVGLFVFAALLKIGVLPIFMEVATTLGLLIFLTISLTAMIAAILSWGGDQGEVKLLPVATIAFIISSVMICMIWFLWDEIAVVAALGISIVMVMGVIGISNLHARFFVAEARARDGVVDKAGTMAREAVQEVRTACANTKTWALERIKTVRKSWALSASNVDGAVYSQGEAILHATIIIDNCNHLQEMCKDIEQIQDLPRVSQVAISLSKGVSTIKALSTNTAQLFGQLQKKPSDTLTE